MALILRFIDYIKTLSKWMSLMLLPVSIAYSSDVEKGEFHFNLPSWHSFARLNGPKEEGTDGGIHRLEVIGGYHRGGMNVTRSDHPLFPVGAPFAAEAVVFVQKTGTNVALKGRIRYIDEEQDQWHGIIRRNDGTIREENSGGAGYLVLTGGTGKYAGIKGKCPYDVSYKKEGFMLVPTKCTWLLRRGER